jgi:RimJ/RimL family protein N-acetyltransferase
LRSTILCVTTPSVPTLTDGVVTLDAFTLGDVDAHVAGEDEEHARRFGWWPDRSTHETAGAAFERWAGDWANAGPTRAFAVRAGGELVGGCQLRLREKRTGEVSYWTFPQHRGRGYAARATRLLCRYAFDTLGLERLEAYVEPDNTASRRVVETVGFVEEGLVRQRELTLHGERRDMVVYGLLPDDQS